ncbi:MAG: UDP-N-acetylglucosamine 4,6-dehydratase (inverting) [Candidatus Omnitrophica bacterium]|nr:UDP-N-acetylglucosamine 4,6-dehydratase (inverting) [Candidatus Omnitrophota bacterium]
MGFEGKVVLVTGGTGSFGRRFTEVLLKGHSPKKLIIFSRDEWKQSEMARNFKDDRVRFFIGDVRDKERLKRAFDGVEIVVHAAALKQIPTAEYNPLEVIKTNILGAANVIDAAIDCGVEKVMALSTDKAANPINLYGATKLCSDKLFIAANVYSGLHKTKFGVVRYGNVVGSRGSVIPLFLKMKPTGKIPITDRRMTRFWITLDQAVALVVEGLEKMHGGEIFVPKVPSMNIGDLAQAIAPQCRHDVVGIRPGEKLHEVMVSTDDARRTVELSGYYVIQPDFPQFHAAGNWKEGKPVPDGFSYASDSNDQWLSKEDLCKLLTDMGEEQLHHGGE